MLKKNDIIAFSRRLLRKLSHEQIELLDLKSTEDLCIKSIILDKYDNKSITVYLTKNKLLSKSEIGSVFFPNELKVMIEFIVRSTIKNIKYIMYLL